MAHDIMNRCARLLAVLQMFSKAVQMDKVVWLSNLRTIGKFVINARGQEGKFNTEQ